MIAPEVGSSGNQPELRRALARAPVGGVALCPAHRARSRLGNQILEGKRCEWEGERVAHQ